MYLDKKDPTGARMLSGKASGSKVRLVNRGRFRFSQAL